jgi:tRNA-modifying protein YgfZ
MDKNSVSSSMANVYTLLQDDAVISGVGEDLVSFLQGQLTSDVAALSDQQAQPSAYCNPKGRMFAAFTLVKDAGSIDFIIPANVAETVRKRLSMFVMRAKAKFTLNADVALIGLANPPANLVGESAMIGENTLVHIPEPVPGKLLRIRSNTALDSRFILMVATADLAAWLTHLKTLGLVPANLQRWRESELASGYARVGAEITELFVPQMLNFELLGAVNFKKGCYPGQEVVARSQYLGKMKRRMFLFASDAPSSEFGLAADVLAVSGANTTGAVEGQIASVAESGMGSKLLIETSTDTFALVQKGEITLTAAGHALVALPQPYEFPVHESLKRVL